MDDLKVEEALKALGLSWPRCRRVLVVDDEPANLFVLEAALDDDYEVLIAESGQEALDILRDVGEVDLVISDQRMPGMTGVELLTRIARSAPETIRMVLTAYTDVEPIVDAVNSGSVYRFLLKPWDEVELLDAVAESLAHKERRTALRQTVGLLTDRRVSLRSTLSSLRRTQDQLVAAERLSTVGRLTSGITHDINNQLSAMMYLVDYVQAEVADGEVLDSAETAYRTLQSLVCLLQDVNAFARSKSIELYRTPQATRDFIQETLSLFALEQAEGPPVDVRVTDEVALIAIDANRLRQAILALLRNALRASRPHDRVSILVSMRGDGCPCVEVVDRGSGMDPRTAEQAMQPFFSNFDPRGLGLGLGIAELVAHAHGGRIELESRPGEGTCARLVLGPDCRVESMAGAA